MFSQASPPLKKNTDPIFYPIAINSAYEQANFYWHARLRSDGFIDADAEEVNIQIYNYIAFEMLVEDFNALLNIQIRLAETKQQGMQIIKEFIQNPERPFQLGLVFFENDNVKGHPITCVLCDDHINNKIVLLVANSLHGIEPYYLSKLKDKGGRLFSDIQEIFPQLDIRFDLTGRQVDDNSSDTDAILYLAAALPRDMLKESTFLPMTMASVSEYVDYLPKPLFSCPLFISPIQTFYHSQATLIPVCANISFSGETKRLIDQLTQYEEMNGLTKKIVLCHWTYGPKLSEHHINTTLWDKAVEFKQLMTAKMQAKSPGLFQTFLNHVHASADKKAVIYNGAKVSYKDFAHTVNQLAVNLKSNYADLFAGNHQPILIGVKCQSKLAALYAEFALLQLGAAFIPFNSDDSINRQAFMQAKSGISLMLIDADEAADDINPLAHCNIIPLLKNELSTKPLPVKEAPTDLAYVLFTSGSTAENPKGVMRTRFGLLKQMVHDYKNDLALTSADCLLNLAVFTHDQAIVDCFAALLNGCTLCLYDVKKFPVNHLHQFMREQEVTVFSSIPSLFATIFADIKDKNTFPALRVVTIGGEESMLDHALLYQRTTPKRCVFINGYGATEMSWISSYFIDHQTELSKLKTIPLGQLTASAIMKLIPFADEESNRKNVYELCISSDSLALGYLQDNEATQEAFFVKDGAGYYRTGDIVSIDINNCLHFVGRKAWHEKIHGKRVNLREIENTLKTIMQVSDCIVLAYGENEDKKLYAFYTKIIEKNALQKIGLELHRQLKSDMIPRLVPIQTLPTLANGKVNRQALRAILKNDIVLSDSDKEAIISLQKSNDPSVVIEGFWREVLDIPVTIPLDKTDSFKTLGGTSWAAMLLINKIIRYFENTHHLCLDLPFFFVSINLIKNNQTNFTSFSNDVLTSYTQMKQGITKYNEPICYETDHFDVPYTQHHWSFYWQAEKNGKSINGKHVKLVFYNYAALQILIDHFNVLLNIKIHLAATNDNGIELIRQFINDPNRPSQIGLIFFKDENTEAHVIPAVLCEDKINKKMILLFADCLNKTDGLYLFYILVNNGLFASIQKKFPQLEICFDLTGRQADADSCRTDAILYLTTALQRNMLKESLFLSATMATVINESHYSYIENFNPYLKSWQLFISPIETFYHSQLTLIPWFFEESYFKDEEKDLIEKLKQYQEEKKMTKKVVLFNWGKRELSEHYINTTVWDKSFEFETIVAAIYAKNQEKEDNQSKLTAQNPSMFFTPANKGVVAANMTNSTNTLIPS